MEFLRKNWGYNQKYLLADPNPMASDISEDLKENNISEEAAKEAKDNRKSKGGDQGESGIYDCNNKL